ncbi:glycine cleavage system protein H [Mesomycoplasma neurolyticum]|uniref:Glycine cleavage system H protein n=1 Tax=Mesomycoplasma neurolyticum TaxID=2120 RepID=A0A449A5L1_9BACT|nr:glycine cleavage system protein H [Mesomycoplasma neurolyticum]VEU59514.1 Glycine cleavage system H protein [Mesomycoplasma neurolyticum]
MKKIDNFLIIEKNGDIYTIYPSAELQDDIGTTGFLQYQKDKKHLKKGDLVLTIEASKAVLYVRTPISGTIIEINENAIKKPDLINSHLDNENWIVKLKDVNFEEFDILEDY